MRLPFKGKFNLTQGFGNKFYSNGVDVYAQYGLKGHNGLDYGTPNDTEIVAPHDGKIIETGNEGGVGYGKYIKIENAKEGSVLAHLKEFKVAVGNVVKEGQVIALSDNTGNSTGAHLHWGYYLQPRNRQNGYAGFIDQFNMIESENSKPMSKLTQEEEDKLRYERDTNWQGLQKALEDIEKLEDRIDDLEEYEEKYNKLLEDYNDLVEASSQNQTIEVPVESGTTSGENYQSGTSTATQPIEHEKPVESSQNETEKWLILKLWEYVKKLLGL